MWTYLIICSWFISGALTFIVLDYYKPVSTKGEYIVYLIFTSILGYFIVFITLIGFILSLDFWQQKINK